MAVQARLKSEKEDRKSLILNKALLLFRQNGLDGTTIRQIAKASKLASGTIYLYFNDKNQIFCELLLEGYALLIAALRQIPPESSSQYRIEDAVDSYFFFALANPEYFTLIFYMVQSSGKGVLDMADKESGMYGKLKLCKDTCLTLVKEYIREICVKLPEDELEKAAEVSWSMLAGVILFFVKDGRKRFDTMAQQAKKMIINSLVSL